MGHTVMIKIFTLIYGSSLSVYFVPGRIQVKHCSCWFHNGYNIIIMVRTLQVYMLQYMYMTLILSLVVMGHVERQVPVR